MLTQSRPDGVAFPSNGRHIWKTLTVFYQERKEAFGRRKWRIPLPARRGQGEACSVGPIPSLMQEGVRRRPPVDDSDTPLPGAFPVAQEGRKDLGSFIPLPHIYLSFQGEGGALNSETGRLDWEARLPSEKGKEAWWWPLRRETGAFKFSEIPSFPGAVTHSLPGRGFVAVAASRGGVPFPEETEEYLSRRGGT